MANCYENIVYTSRVFTPKQFTTLLALADTYYPSLTPTEVDNLLKNHIANTIIDPKTETIEKWLRQASSECREFVETLDYFFYARIPGAAKAKVALVLDLLGGGIATLLLTIPHFTFSPFSSLPLSHRIDILTAWSQSYVPMLRQLHRQLQMIFSNTLLKCNKVLLNALEYPIPTPGGKNGSSAVGSSDFEQEYFNFKFLDLESEGGTVGIPEGLFQPSPYSGSSITPAAPSDNITLHFDLIIVGSGSGGGVVASTLAQSLIHKFPGYRILVIDKGTFYPPPTSLPMSEMDTAEKMCDNGGLLPSVDGEGLMIGGSTWGGGSVINWGISLDLEEDVRKEWSQKHGLNWMVKETKEVSIENEDITDNEWDSCLSHVKNIMGVSLLSSPSLHNVPNTLISEGARKAGYHPVPVSHNNGEDSEAHADCGYCSGGCQRGLKKAGSVSWLVDAAKAGAMCLKEFDVERIIWNTETGGSDSGNWGQKNKPKRVEGVEGRVVKTNGKGRAVKLMASKVILAAGAIRTPCILQNSGLKNPNIGKNLKCHPVFMTVGFKNNQVLNPWLGTSTSVVVPDLSHLSSTNYGSKLMLMDHHPAVSMTAIPWASPGSYKYNLLRYKHSATVVSVVRDKDSSGTVVPTSVSNSDPTGTAPKINYTVSKFDQNSAIQGICASIKILLAAGFDEVIPCIPSLPQHLFSYKSPTGITNPEEILSHPTLATYLSALKSYGPGKGWVSAHLMATTPLGGSPQNSVVDATTGKVWGTEGLYIADGGLFPTASGVNPMLTIMGLAEWVGRKVVALVSAEQAEMGR